MKEVDNLKRQFSERKQEYDQQNMAGGRLTQESRQKSAELKAHAEEISWLKQEMSYVSKLREIAKHEQQQMQKKERKMEGMEKNTKEERAEQKQRNHDLRQEMETQLFKRERPEKGMKKTVSWAGAGEANEMWIA